MVLERRAQHADPETAAQESQTHPCHVHHREPRRVPGKVLRHPVRHGPARRTRGAHRGEREEVPRHPRPPVRRAGALQPGARARRDGALRQDSRPERLDQPDSPQLRLRLLVVRLVHQAAREERREVRDRLRGHDAPVRPQERDGGRDLRAHPPAGDPPGRGHVIHELRGLGRELHGAGRGLRRQLQPHSIP